MGWPAYFGHFSSIYARLLFSNLFRTNNDSHWAGYECNVKHITLIISKSCILYKKLVDWNDENHHIVIFTSTWISQQHKCGLARCASKGKLIRGTHNNIQNYEDFLWQTLQNKRSIIFLTSIYLLTALIARTTSAQLDLRTLSDRLHVDANTYQSYGYL